MHNTKILFNDLIKKVSYLSNKQIKPIYKAFEISKKAHQGQYRKSGEEYIIHPLSVAMILAELNLDSHTISAAILHDCIEDTYISASDIKKQFNKDTANLVEGVSKLENLKFNSELELQARNFQKLLLAMNKDIRVILIKIADRLHNMRTLESMTRIKQIRIAKETLDIYAPIAKKLGLNVISTELEDLGFRNWKPLNYKIIQNYLNKKTTHHKKIIATVKKELTKALKKEKYKVEISGRVKEPYSIYLKMKQQKLKFNEIFDIYAFRLITDNLTNCYQVLGSVHNIYKPMPGKFKDYIALPKANGYQSLHTVLFVKDELLIEIQIRNQEMHQIAETGVASHQSYKLNEKFNITNQFLDSLLSIQQNSSNCEEFINDVKVNLFPNEVFVFTPKGDIIQLPYNATALDFAYAIHTNIGNKCTKIYVDGKPTAFNYKLKSGQTIKVITQDSLNIHPNRLNLVWTAKAKASIRNILKKNSNKKSYQLGKTLLTTSLQNKGIELTKVSKEKIHNILVLFTSANIDELFIKIGLGDLRLDFVVDAFFSKHNDINLPHLTIQDNSDLEINFAHCCYPIPNDDVIGIINKGNGLVIHRKICKNYNKSNYQTIVNSCWDDNLSKKFQVGIRIEVQNHHGILANISNIISEMAINIEDLSIKEKQYQLKYLDFVLTVQDTIQLEEIFTNIKKNKFVLSIQRFLG
ncbi:GTP pyrophosphokinase, (p)ppGpp synthetase I [hydrothermal vent metagenome]|uniref:GTP pyrophosphokinase, (P)ppGpp synthetase I n=1 Tax=hydrothermal vent metagenome TaxID=652676 RepID=A0A1W1CD10_9ZZZZ